MAFQSSPVLDFSFKAAEDLRNHQYCFVRVNKNAEIQLLKSDSELPDGVLQNFPNTREEATVRILGISKVRANSALEVGTFVKSLINGYAENYEESPQLITGRVMGASQSKDDLCSVLLTPYVGL